MVTSDGQKNTRNTSCFVFLSLDLSKILWIKSIFPKRSCSQEKIFARLFMLLRLQAWVSKFKVLKKKRVYQEMTQVSAIQLQKREQYLYVFTLIFWQKNIHVLYKTVLSHCKTATNLKKGMMDNFFHVNACVKRYVGFLKWQLYISLSRIYLKLTMFFFSFILYNILF